MDSSAPQTNADLGAVPPQDSPAPRSPSAPLEGGATPDQAPEEAPASPSHHHAALAMVQAAPAPPSPSQPVLVRRAPPLPPSLPAIPKAPKRDKALPPAASRPTTRSANGARPRLTRYGSDAEAEGSIADGDDNDEEGAKAKAAKNRWTKEEDAELLRIISLMPSLSWDDIAAQMPGRKASGCSMRWYNFVRKTADPNMRQPGAAAAPEVGDNNVPAGGAGDATFLVAQGSFKGKGKTKSMVPRAEKALAESQSPAPASRGAVASTSSASPDHFKDAARKDAPSTTVSEPSIAPKARTIYSEKLKQKAGKAKASATLPLPSRAAPLSTTLEDGRPILPRPPVIRGRRTYSPGQLEGTLFTPSGKKQKVHPCPAEECSAAFRRSEHLKRHFRSVHMGAKPYPCHSSDCDKSFSRKDNLQQHMKMVHHVDMSPPPSEPAPRYPACLKPIPVVPAVVASSLSRGYRGGRGRASASMQPANGRGKVDRSKQYAEPDEYEIDDDEEDELADDDDNFEAEAEEDDEGDYEPERGTASSVSRHIQPRSFAPPPPKPFAGADVQRHSPLVPGSSFPSFSTSEPKTWAQPARPFLTGSPVSHGSSSSSSSAKPSFAPPPPAGHFASSSTTPAPSFLPPPPRSSHIIASLAADSGSSGPNFDVDLSWAIAPELLPGFDTPAPASPRAASRATKEAARGRSEMDSGDEGPPTKRAKTASSAEVTA